MTIDMEPLSKDTPLVKAWEVYKASGEYRNSRHWAAQDEYLDGSMWAVFMEGWAAAMEAASPTPAHDLATAVRNLASRLEQTKRPVFDDFDRGWVEAEHDVAEQLRTLLASEPTNN